MKNCTKPAPFESTRDYGTWKPGEQPAVVGSIEAAMRSVRPTVGDVLAANLGPAENRGAGKKRRETPAVAMRAYSSALVRAALARQELAEAELALGKAFDRSLEAGFTHDQLNRVMKLPYSTQRLLSHAKLGSQVALAVL